MYTYTLNTMSTKDKLIARCKELGIRGYTRKTKEDLLQMISSKNTKVQKTEEAPKPIPIQRKKAPSKPIKLIDLFAGTGAFSLAFTETEKVETVFANDMIKESKIIYDENFSHPLTHADMHDLVSVNLPDCDVITGGFPCFIAGTKVLTDSGYKNIEDVSLDNKLFTHTGVYQKILNKQIKTGATEFKSIKINYHPHNIVATPEHPFYVRERIKEWNNTNRNYEYSFKEPEWVHAKDLNKNHYVGMPVNTDSIIPEFTFQKQTGCGTIKDITVILNNEDQWFLMGYFMGDGFVQYSKKEDGKIKYYIYFSIADKDVETVLPILQRVIPITTKYKKSGNYETYECSNFEWYYILKHFGKYSHNKCIPEWVQSSPTHLIQAFLDGYKNADKCIESSSRGIQNHNISYTTISEHIAFGVQRLYLKIGKICQISYCKRPSTYVIEDYTLNQTNTYKLVVTINNQQNQSSFINDNYAWIKIKEYESITMEPQTVYNFEVEHDNSYCIENAIVHNCQPFSISGYRKGFEDTRSNTFWKVCEIIDAKHPKVVILENVKNLVSHDDGKTFETIKINLEKRGYTLVYKVLNTAEITAVPQHRERIYVVGFKSSELAKKFSLDFPRYSGLTEKPCVSTCFEDRDIPTKYYYTDKSSTWDLVSAEVTKPNTIYQYRRVYVRENKSQECPTLTANMGGGGHNVPLIRDARGIRKLTPRECFNFQGFPASYKLPALADSHLYKLAGNAVSVPVVRLIANRIVPLLLEDVSNYTF